MLALLGQRAPFRIGQQQVDADGGAPRQRGVALGVGRQRRSYPSGDSSVMPQLVCTVTPSRRSIRSISAGGIGAPPTTIRSSDGTSPPVRLEMLDQTEPDGGHADRDRHAFRHDQPGEAGAVRTGVRAAPARAPTAGAAKGMPQALAWNIGTTGRTVSFAVMPITSACSSRSVCR